VLGISPIIQMLITLTKDYGIFFEKKFFEISNFQQKIPSEFNESQDGR